jgi:hypothetical protein
MNKNIHPLKIADWPILVDSTIKPSMLGGGNWIIKDVDLIVLSYYHTPEYNNLSIMGQKQLLKVPILAAL